LDGGWLGGRGGRRTRGGWGGAALAAALAVAAVEVAALVAAWTGSLDGASSVIAAGDAVALALSVSVLSVPSVLSGRFVSPLDVPSPPRRTNITAAVATTAPPTRATVGQLLPDRTAMGGLAPGIVTGVGEEGG
jgi:hypothetical protein